MSVCNKPEKDLSYKMLNEKKTNVKCVIVGDAMVGKTSLACRLACLGFATDYNPTTFDNYVVTTSMAGKSYVLSLFDTAGQEEYIHLRALSYVNCDVFLLCFSVATPESLQQAHDKWLPELHRFSPNTPLVLVATQIDRRDDGPEVISNDFSSATDTGSGKPLMTSNSAPGSAAADSAIAPSSGVTKSSSSRRGSHKHSQVVAPSAVKLKLHSPFVSFKEGQQAADRLHADCYIECSSLTEVGISRLREAAIEFGLRRPDSDDKKGCNCSCVVL